MIIQPKKRILATNPYPTNPLGIQVHVADDEARDAVNKFSGEPFVVESSFLSGGKIVGDGKFEGYFRMNPCYDMADVIGVIESALEVCDGG